MLTVASVTLASCGGGGGGKSTVPTVATPTPTPTPTATPTSASTGTSPNAATAYNCPTSDAATAVARSSATLGSEATRRSNGLRTAQPASVASGLLAVTYKAATLGGSAAATIAARERAAGGSLVQTLAFSHTGTVIHVLSVAPAHADAVAAALRSQAGVESVAATGARRYATTVTTPDTPNDPYMQGFTLQQNQSAGSSAPATVGVSPFESAGVPGQWDMHAIGLEYAFGYSLPVNGSSVTSVSGALGSSAIKIAIIDTGEDSTHPDLAGKIVYQKCFITNASGVQTSSNFETDPLGHGTDVSGIAAADTNNAFGFAGAGGKTEIYAYRVFPTPDDSCASTTAPDPQCGSSTVDIASAIDDAVAQHVNVISMSLGGDGCGTGSTYAANGDSDKTEGAAVAEAIAANIIVVAASGNSAPGTAGVAAPACDTGVIAVGASALGDGTTSGTAGAPGTAGSPVEYVASYSQSGTTNTYHSASSWGIVAPGGDPNGNNDADDLHWIENIWTSTPYQLNAMDTSFTGECTDDYPNSTGTTAPVDCRTLIAGTSMSTPHVAGAAALILAVNTSYQSPAAMKQLLCQTADNIGGNQGCGRLNVYRAMATAVGDPVLP